MTRNGRSKRNGRPEIATPKAAKKQHITKSEPRLGSPPGYSPNAPTTQPELRKLLRNVGFSPIPITGKKPPLNGWQKKLKASDEEVESWDEKFPNANSTGLLTRNMPTLDIDIKIAEAAAAVEELVRKRFGSVLVRFGNAPKRAIPFKTDKPFKKIVQNLLAPGETEPGQKIELLADGQQIVAFGIHKDTLKPYKWVGGEPGTVKRDELPTISEAVARQLVKDAVELLVRDHGYTRTKKKKPKPGTDRAADWGYLAENIHAGHELHDSLRDLAAKLVKSGMSEGAAVNFLYGLMDTSAAKDSERWKERRDDIPRLVGSAAELPANAPDWRERYKDDGRPKPSFHNARVAILAVGIKCSHDIFHHQLLFGYEGDKEKHVVEFMLGEVNDDGITALRLVLSNHFGFDLTEKHIRDAVVSLANENRFDPIADLLAKAEAEWDGVKRLDRMAVDYFNTEDTPFNRAATRKWMIAGVARVRNPGCKFDNVLVLESDEGFYKSTALAILACGPENFSDERIIGKESREVQEQLSSIWIHENAELAGMRKAEVETVKAFASRQVDRARPAYGHFQKEQKRHSIEAATTNSHEYMQGQEGNRRLWPELVLKPIDIGKLKRDVLQLWGEAAHYQSKGESLVLDEKLWPDAAIEQEKRRVKDPWEAIIAAALEIPKGQEDTGIIDRSRDKDCVASTDLLQRVLNIPTAQLKNGDTQRLANAMRGIGWLRNPNGKVWFKDKQVRGYYRPRL